MKIAFALLIIFFLAFSGYHLTFRNIRLPLFARQFYLTGSEFLFLGLLLGPLFLNLLDLETQKYLDPLRALLLGWIGLLFGSQFEVSKLRRFPRVYFSSAVLEGILVLIIVSLAAYFMILPFSHTSSTIGVVMALTLGATAACTSHGGLALVGKDSGSQFGKLFTLLRYLSGIDGILPLLVFGFSSSLLTASFSSFSLISVLTKGFLMILGSSLGLVIILVLFLSERRRENELALIVFGATLLASGMAFMVKMSPLLINFIIGTSIVNLSREKERIYEVLIAMEKPAYLLILVFLGAIWRFDSAWIFVLAAVYCLVRLLAKLFAGFLITVSSTDMTQYPYHLGLGLLHQGGLPLAMLLEFQQGFPPPMSSWIVSLVLIAVLYNDILGPLFVRRLLKKNRA